MKVLLWCVVVSAITFTVAPANGGVEVKACFGINVSRKGLISLLTAGAGVSGVHSLVWLKYVSVFNHL
jgi:hypothetical protein